MNRDEQEDTTIAIDGKRMATGLLVISLLLSIIGLSTDTLGQPARGQHFRAGKAPPARFSIGQVIAGFRVVAHYTNHTEQVVGLRLTHLATGLPVHFLWMDTAPQAALMIRTFPEADHGAAHALEHLLLGKGTTGRALQTLADMRLGRYHGGYGRAIHLVPLLHGQWYDIIL